MLDLLPRLSPARRIPRRERLVLALPWAAAAVVASALFATLPAGADALFTPPATVWRITLDDRLFISALGALPIALSRSRPVQSLIAALAELLAAVPLGLQNPLPMVCVAAILFVVCSTRSRPVGIGAAVASFAGWAGQEVAADPRFPANDQAGTAILMLTVAFVAGVLVRERREHGRVVREQTAAQAVTAERLRIARELHDMVAHSIGIVAIQAGAAKRVIETQPVRAREALDAIETTSRETLAGLRHMLGALRQAESDRDGLAPAPGLADVERLAADAAGAGLLVEVQWRGDRRPVPREVDLSAFRIIQEAVTNVIRHAGTQHCRVGVEFGGQELVVEIVDDGRGAANAQHATRDAQELGGFGLAGMRERVNLLHGRFTAGPRPEGGFRVEARLPA